MNVDGRCEAQLNETSSNSFKPIAKGRPLPTKTAGLAVLFLKTQLLTKLAIAKHQCYDQLIFHVLA